jgi:nicotinate phosphoribosyltransferase
MLNDVVTVLDDMRNGRALLQQVMHEGLRTQPQPSLTALREYAAQELASLPAPLRELGREPPYPVLISESLRKLAARLDSVDLDG